MLLIANGLVARLMSESRRFHHRDACRYWIASILPFAKKKLPEGGLSI
jgi:hypothetical protein